MKRLIVLLVMLSLFVSNVQSQLLIENFDYPQGDSLSQHGWTTFSGTGTNTVFIETPGLSFSNYTGSGIGNHVKMKNGGQDSYREFISGRNSGSLYASFMVKVDTGRSGDYFFALLDSNSSANFRGRVHARVNAGALNFGITKAANSDVTQWGTTGYSFDSTYLLVLKYTFIPGTANDEVSLFVFSPGQTIPIIEPAPAIGPSAFPSSDPTAPIKRLILRQGAPGASATVNIDGIYVVDYWDSGLLPVELSSFTSSVTGNDVFLEWSTSQEMNNAGFHLERKRHDAGSWSEVAYINGSGTIGTSVRYTYSDVNVPSGRYKYRLKQTDFNGAYEYLNLSNEVLVGIPLRFELFQNYPNPFNPATQINFQIPENSNVMLDIYDAGGKLVRTVVNEIYEAGYHSVNINAAEFSSGIYFYTLTAGSFTTTKRMMLIK